MSNEQAELFIDSRNSLGEGPFWHHLRDAFFWFDINAGKLLAADLDGQSVGEWAFDEPVSAAGIVSKDVLGVVSASGLIELNLETNARRVVVEIEDDVAETRGNDSRVGPGGSFWIGTMARDGNSPIGNLYHWGQGKLQALRENVYIPNCICFSPAGDRAYFTHMRPSIIETVSIDPATGLPNGEWEVFRETGDDRGSPDGAVVDSEGYLWNARWGGNCVIRFSPDGEIDRIIEVPTPQVTCPAFGGPEGKTLFLTSAHQGMDDAQRAQEVHAGSVFKIETDIVGQQERLLQL